MFKRLILAAVVSTFLGATLSAQAPKQLSAVAPANTTLATAVANKLSTSGKLNNYQVDVIAAEGKIQLVGKVQSAAQAEAALAIAKEVAGVTEVSNGLTIAETITQSGMMKQEPAPAPMPTNEPIPSFHAGMAGGPVAGAEGTPPMPPYAWPSYAPYNNFSRVGYPNVYPKEAMPYIGPINPFPKAPLGWRNVILSFDDGIWYLSSHAGNRDWWTVRYW